jgi:RES domain-containing protein
MASPRSGKASAYRIVSRAYGAFDAPGTYRWGSRWISPGRWVVHAAETYSLAVLENLVHWQTAAPPPSLVCVEVTIPDDLKQERVEAAAVPRLKLDDYSASRTIGDAWYDRGETGVLWVPSVVSPYESNVLFNRQHEDFARIVVGSPIPARVDPRLRPKRSR